VRPHPRLLAPLLAAAVAAAGCGSDAPTTGGGRVVGDSVTIYSSLPDPGRGAARDIVAAQKLALLQADGQAGGLDVNFVSVDEGSAGSDVPPGAAANVAEEVIRDPQVIAVIGTLRSQTAMTTIPLYNAAGILHVGVGASYTGFTSPARPGEPERWYPSGRMTFGRMVFDDDAQAAALLAAARFAAPRDGGLPRVAVEAEAGRFAQALADSIAGAATGRVRLVTDSARADAVVYAGTDLESAVGVAEGLARENPDAALVFPDELTRAGLAERLDPAARRRAVLVSSVPEPGSTPELREFEAAFAAEFGRRPGPYAVLGWRAMRSVLDAMDRAGERSNVRRAVIDAWFERRPMPTPWHAEAASRVGRSSWLPRRSAGG
jgi:branched-chain amino acid transport system substrate-binding protein